MPVLSWPEVHGALTHFPIVFLLLAPFFDLGSVFLKKPEWRTVSFWMLVGTVLGAIPSLATGWITGNTLFPDGAIPPALFYQHRLVAFTLSGVALVLLAWRALAKD